MNMNDRVLARRYALALYQSAQGLKEEKTIAEELSAAARALSANMSEFSHPRVTLEDKKSRLRAALGGKYSKRTLRFLELLIEKKRFILLPQMAVDLGKIYDEGRGVVHASVRAAHELDEGQKMILAERLGAFVGKSVVLDVRVDETLLGGAVVRLGDWTFDASLKGKLRTLRGRLAA
ncbi:MAG: ATP synthase F1 subunit delta [Elusimicrobia bacterium CG1_02_63_36]|nr:MAG: ATP synthase F1 subunit delta [Elusimicrobia bacterium CG1_02_63_36]PIP81450.1 MAG: ATP synthase F1 subunit delta [Elusimicrobia bacterium CG22_combo_CG10-13_8_21_14_all_63_91]PJA17049.1 MAG: ATP synthase F1 subunit delta [Elusimicrobia bacterium CG_4_10_14_0_2_um_filter_63_34]PJB25080.1 MAG: ATP synthase F1 subunit delta [Elusimicrobia bacterium CG_4_9_14_3_um_filter_62_55]